MADEPLSNKDIEKELKTQSSISDIIDLYDHDVEVLGKIWADVQMKFSRLANSRKNLDELEKVMVDHCLQVGLIVRVHTSECLMGIGPVTVEPIGRLSDAHEGFFDHERKRAEVLLSKTKNETFLGEKEKHSL